MQDNCREQAFTLIENPAPDATPKRSEVRRHQYNSSCDVLNLGIFNTTKPPSVIGAEVEIYASGTWLSVERVEMHL